jgi:hypothetical protein
MEQLSLALKHFFTFTVAFIVGFTMVFGVTGMAFAQTVQTKGINGQTGQANPGSRQDGTLNIQTGQNQSANTGSNPNNATVSTPASNGTQAASVSGGNAATSSGQVSTQGVIDGVTSCAASIVGSAVSGAMGQLLGGQASTDTRTRLNTTGTNEVAHSGNSTGWPPSLDSIGYCIVNAVIEYLTTATIEWINSGFDGNPAFVENPEQFFSDLADIETAGFLQEVVSGATGINICEPFRMQIVTGLAQQGSPNSFANQSRCTLEQIGAAASGSGVDFDYNDYTSGQSPYSGSLTALREVTQNDQNNFIGSYFLSQQELQKRLAVKQNTAQLDLSMGRGFLSYKTCNPDSTTTDDKGNTIQVKGACGVKTPGSVIEDQLNRTLGAGKDRLVMADKFDQVITALVDQLIKVALNEVLSTGEETGQ